MLLMMELYLSGISCYKIIKIKKSYTLFYFAEIRNLREIGSYIFIVGQVVDAFFIIIIGILSDKYETKYGKRTPWYIGGIIFATIGFIPIYFPLIPEDTTEILKIIYFISFAVLFSMGYASSQISHMSLIPSLTCSRNMRDKLNGSRNTFTFF
jgi:Na+/melibiose symporter-like transporter